MNDSSDGSMAREEGPHTPQEMVICRPSLPAALMNSAAAAVENDDGEEPSPWETVPVQEKGPRYPEVATLTVSCRISRVYMIKNGHCSCLSTTKPAVVAGSTVMNDSSDGSTAPKEGPHTPQEMVICRPSLPSPLMNVTAAVENDDSEELSQWEMVPLQETGHRYPEELV